MREIKFRVWSKKYNKMYLPEKGCDLLLRIDGKLFVDIDILENVGIEPIDRDELELMEFTGLTDKKGKEVFEGDIIRYYFDMGGGKTYRDVYIEDIRIDTEKLEEILKEDGEVIGNAYENPELLKGGDLNGTTNSNAR